MIADMLTIPAKFSLDHCRNTKASSMFNQLANNKMNLDDADGKKISLDDIDDRSMRLDDADEQS